VANDSDRVDFVNNDEGLYDLWRRSKKGITTWVRENRKLIDTIMGAYNEGTIPAHYLKYGG
jgi:hypothetical protein